MRLRSMALLLIGCALAFASPARSAEEGNPPYDALPRDTALVLRIASIDKISAGFKELMGALGPAAAPASAQFERGLGELFQIGATIDAVERSAPLFVAMFPIEGRPDPVAYFVQTADEAKLRRAVLKAGPDESLPATPVAGGFDKVVKNDQTWYFKPHGQWVLYTHNEQVLQKLVFDPAAKAFATLVEPRAAEALAAGDGAILVNVEDLRLRYAGEIDRARDQLKTSIQGLSDDQLGGNGPNPEVVRRILADLANLAFDSLGDVRWFAGRVNFSAAGASVAAVLAVNEASGTDAILSANPPSDFEILGLLPAGAPIYFGHSVNYDRLLAWAAERLKGAYGGDAENAQLETALAAIRSAGAGPAAGSFALPADSTSGQLGIALQQAENPDALRQGSRSLRLVQGQTTTVRVNNMPLHTQTTQYQEGAESYQERPVDLMTVKFEMAKVDDPGLMIAQQFLRAFFGGDSLQRRITVLEGMLVEASGNDPKFLHQAIGELDTGKGVLGLDAAFAKTRDQLDERANLVVLANAPQLIVDLVKLLREIPTIAPFLAQVPFNFGVQPEMSFAGLSVGTEPQALKLRIFVPAAQPKGVLQIFGRGF